MGHRTNRIRLFLYPAAVATLLIVLVAMGGCSAVEGLSRGIADDAAWLGEKLFTPGGVE